MRYKISNYELLKQLVKLEPEGNACVLWPRGVNRHGYVAIWSSNGKYEAAHRLAYNLTHDTPVSPELDVCHTCDVGHCIRGSHLFPGSALDNMRDCIAKGRFKGHLNLPKIQSMPGESNPAAKLKASQVIEIRRIYAAGGRSQQSIADEFGIWQTIVSAIVRRKIWKHL